MRRLRHPRTRPRRRPPRLFRAVRAAAPRPGVGGNRGERKRTADDGPRPGPRRPGLRRAGVVGAPRRARDRSQPVLHNGRKRLGERSADRPSRPCAHGRAGPQRKPRQRRSAACRNRQTARLDLRLRGDRRTHRRRRAPARGGARGDDEPPRGSRDRRRAHRWSALRVPRSARVSAAGAGLARRRPGRCVRKLRPRADRRPVRA